MRLRHGQVALYLIAVLVAVTVLVMMNVGVFLSVRTKNRAMNAGDAAAIAVAGLQGSLLNEIGRLNIEHMKAALAGDWERCGEITNRQVRICLLGPLDGVAAGNEAAAGNGAHEDASGGMLELLRRHVAFVRQGLADTPDLYPEPYEGAWTEYADRLESVVGGLVDGLVAGPDNIEFIGALHQPPLVDEGFYDAIEGRDWCWFYGKWEHLFDCGYAQMPYPDVTQRQPCHNSEIYSLHLDFRGAPVDSAQWRETVKLLTGCDDATFENSAIITNTAQVWAFYDSRWRKWHEMSLPYPVRGDVKPEYDVLGCAAACRVYGESPGLAVEGGHIISWQAAAKPFGTVTDVNGEIAPVTALMRLVTPAFEDVRLVPYYSVYDGNCMKTADTDWMTHVREHLDDYLASGPKGRGCRYCTQLLRWEDPSFRAAGKTWLNLNWQSCRRPRGGGSTSGGGVRYGH